MSKLPILAILAIAALAVGCGGADGSATASNVATRAEGAETEATPTPAASTTATRRSRHGKKVSAIGSSYGRVIADGRGEAYYLFGKETGKGTRCYGECARAWPPVLSKGRPRAGRGVKARLLGTTRRKNGKLQVTYGGHPLYYYVDDSPGRILCQNVTEFGGLWLVVKPSGSPVT
jgi:predicted lipoprotein with Yx(FWY)xxD motif